MRLRCVIVDDSDDFVDSARRLLENQGALVVGVAATGQEALHRLRHVNADVVLVDARLGAESGFEVTRRLREAGGVGGPPVVIISTQAEEDWVALAAASQAIGFLAKAELSAAALHTLLARAGHSSGGPARRQ